MADTGPAPVVAPHGNADVPRNVLAGSARLLTYLRELISKFDVQQMALMFTCMIFLLVVLYPILISHSILWHFDTLKSVKPDFLRKSLKYIVSGSAEDFSRLTAFITPFFALLAGLKSRTGNQTVFFTLFVCLSLYGAVGSLMAKYFLMSLDGQNVYKATPWLDYSELQLQVNMDKWLQQINTYFTTSFQTFIGFLSILLGLKAAER